MKPCFETTCNFLFLLCFTVLPGRYVFVLRGKLVECCWGSASEIRIAVNMLYRWAGGKVTWPPRRTIGWRSRWIFLLIFIGYTHNDSSSSSSTSYTIFTDFRITESTGFNNCSIYLFCIAYLGKSNETVLEGTNMVFRIQLCQGVRRYWEKIYRFSMRSWSNNLLPDRSHINYLSLILNCLFIRR